MRHGGFERTKKPSKSDSVVRGPDDVDSDDEWEEAGDQVRLGRLLLTPPDGARLVREFQTQASKPEEVKTQRRCSTALGISFRNDS